MGGKRLGILLGEEKRRERMRRKRKGKRRRRTRRWKEGEILEGYRWGREECATCHVMDGDEEERKRLERRIRTEEEK